MTNTNDSGAGSLRAAITAANNTVGASTIDFNISGSGAQTIDLLSALPIIGNAVTIDGSSQTGFAGTPLIVLDGSGAGAGANGLTIAAGNSTVKDLAIDHFNGDGILLEVGGGDTLTGNYIGVDATGTTAAANGFGVYILSANNIIGGTTAGDLNVISGNNFGVAIAGSGASGNAVEGNYIGTDATGAAKLANTYGVVLASGSANNTIGGTTSAALNVISGNSYSGVQIQDSGISGNVVQGNYIGTDKTGTAALGNGYGVAIYGSALNTVDAGNVLSGNTFGVAIYGSGASDNTVQGNYIGTDKTGANALANAYGVYIDGASNNVVGGTTATDLNVLSGNTFGVVITGSGASGNAVQGNYIGTDLTGTKAVGNTYGVFVADGAVGNTVGGSTTAALNVLSGNSYYGVEIESSGSTGNVVEGNYIGTDKTGLVALGNGAFGVALIDGASNNVVGGTTTTALNVISANTYYGVEIVGSGTSGNVVQGNYIGTDKSGAKAMANGYGVYIASGSASNTVGSTVPGAANVLSGNGFGVVVSGSSGNVVEGNYIGTDLTGAKAVANAFGVYVYSSATNNIIGGTGAADRNIISANSGGGVFLTGSGTTGNVVEGDYIGTDYTGTAKLGNLYGVVINGSANNTVGDTVSGAENVISANTEYGVDIEGSGATGNVLQGNYIGTDVTGTTLLGNGLDGVIIGSANNTVGGTAAGAGNVLSANLVYGVNIDGSGATGNAVEGNYIGTDVAGAAGLGNGLDGVYIGSANNAVGGTVSGAGNVIAYNGYDGVEVSTGTGNAIRQNSIHDNGNLGIELINNGNNNQPAPLLTSAITNGNSITIQGSLSAADSTAYALDFFATPSGAGEGQQYLGSATVTTNGTGTASFTVTFNVSVPSGYVVSATATDPGGNTSAFANDVTTTSNVFLVINTNDSGTGSLRQAILDANGMPGSSTIDFAISGSGAQTISLASALPTITSAVVINGASQSGFAGTPLIVLDGTSAGAGANGLTIAAGNSFVEDLAIDNFKGDGIELETGGDDVLTGNYIGAGSNGATVAGNGYGVYINGSANNTIGGTTAAALNVISANTNDGVLIAGSSATGNVVQGNYIGTDVTGAKALANTIDGVLIESANNTVGGTAAGAGNLISGNGTGVYIDGSGASGNAVQGNDIGTDVTGKIALANTDGVYIYAAANNTVGGTAAGALNVISGNSGGGVYITGNGATGNAVQGNFIGTDKNGTAKLGNNYGVYIDGSANNVVGGTTAGALNVISGNTNTGVAIFGSGGGGTGNVVEGNYIGTDKNGTAKLGNGSDGVSIGSAGNTVGGTATAARNVISGNGTGVDIFDSGGSGNMVQGNYIGTDVTGTANLGNDMGVVLTGPSNTVGGTTAGARNVISANSGNGVYLVRSGASGNVVEGNYIGTDATGANALGNGAGVYIFSANNTVGGTTTAARNVISGNGDGVLIVGNPEANIVASGNVVEGNYIGTDYTGTAKLGNVYGVYINGSAGNNASADNVVGTTAAGATVNVISGNTGGGVYITGSGAVGNAVQGNYIGTDKTGTVALGNLYGVEIANGATNTYAASNVISGNIDGVYITGSSTTANGVYSNYIGTDVTGIANLGNYGDGVYIYQAASNSVAGNIIAYNGYDGVHVDTGTGNPILENSIYNSGNLGIDLTNGGNGGLLPPVLASANTNGNSITIQATLGANAVPNTYYYLDFFASPTANKSGSGEGQLYLGSATVIAKASGPTAFTVTFNASVPAGYVVSATATEEVTLVNNLSYYFSNTSTFAADVKTNANIFVVTNTGDNGGTNPAVGAGTGTLRQAIVDANAAGGSSLIDFNIPGGGAQTISLLSALPALTAAVTINGASQPGFTGTPLIVLDGTNAGASANGLVISGGNSFVEDLAIDHFKGNVSGLASGIVLQSGGDDVLTGNYIGVDSSGTAGAGNGDGVYIYNGSSNNTIGGTTAGTGNVISANTNAGVDIADSSATGNVVEGNDIGTDVTGTAKLANGYGVLINSANNLIGGTTAAARNVISANTNDGVNIEGSGATGNAVQGNYIGTDVTGTAYLGNGNDGVYIASASNVVGGTVPGAANVISANANNGVSIDGSTVSGVSGNMVQGNYIGTDVTGTKALGNTNYGVYIYESASNIIGGTTAAARNVISANFAGVVIDGSGASGNMVQGNYIGTDVTGTANLGNGIDGVYIDSANNTVGGTDAGAGNVISANTAYGVAIEGSGVSGNAVQGNYIGTDVSGAANLGNGIDGVYLFDAANNTVGGTDGVTTSNVIAYNKNDGVEVDGGSGNTIRQNSIHDSGNLGIELVNNGNNNQAAPTLNAAATNGSILVIRGTLTAAANTNYILDFYASPTANPSGYGEGQLYLGSGTVTTDNTGKASFLAGYYASVPAGYVVTATATDPKGNTSAFANDVTVANDGTTSAGLVILPTFDSSITNDPNAAAIENAINAAIQVYEHTYTNPITVRIYFSEMASGLGQSITGLYSIGYQDFLTGLAANQASSGQSDQATALAHLPNQTNNPVTNNAYLVVKSANARALGFNAPGDLTSSGNFGGTYDGVISLNTSLTFPPQSNNGSNYSLQAVVEHEIDEVLGLGSTLPNPDFNLGSGPIPIPEAEDLYRYDGSGNRSFTTNSSTKAYFSLDGTTQLAQFDNQNDGGDFGDWQSNPLPTGVLPQVQDAFATPGATPSLGVELTALDVLGYDRASSGSSSAKPVSPGATLSLGVEPMALDAVRYDRASSGSSSAKPVLANFASPLTAVAPPSHSDGAAGSARDYLFALLGSGGQPTLSLGEGISSNGDMAAHAAVPAWSLLAPRAGGTDLSSSQRLDLFFASALADDWSDLSPRHE